MTIRRERVSGLAALLAITLVGIACSGGGQPSTPAGPTTSSTTPPAASSASPIPLATGPVAAGSYTVPRFPVAMSFQVGEGWQSSHLADLTFDLVRPEGALIFMFLPDGPTPEAFVGSLAEKGLSPTTLEAGTLDQAPSQRTVIHADEAATVVESPPEAAYGLRPGTDVSLDLVPLGDGLLVVAVEARAGALAPAQAEADAVLATVRLEPD
jgi:hypothetical protein